MLHQKLVRIVRYIINILLKTNIINYIERLITIDTISMFEIYVKTVSLRSFNVIAE